MDPATAQGVVRSAPKARSTHRRARDPPDGRRSRVVELIRNRLRACRGNRSNCEANYGVTLVPLLLERIRFALLRTPSLILGIRGVKLRETNNDANV